MATTVSPPRIDNILPTFSADGVHSIIYPRGPSTTETDDPKSSAIRSPQPSVKNSYRASTLLLETQGRTSPELRTKSELSSLRSMSATPAAAAGTRRAEVEANERSTESPRSQSFMAHQQAVQQQAPQQAQQQPQQQQHSSFYYPSVSYALPAGLHRVAERYNLEASSQRAPSRASGDIKPLTDSTIVTPFAPSSRPPSTHRQHSPGGALSQERQYSTLPRHPSLPGAMVHPSPGVSNCIPNSPSLSPLPQGAAPTSFNPSLGIPISPKPRAYAQHPTYVIPQPAPNPLNTVYSPVPHPPEDICVECAMRDQDMAGVDVTSPGVWDRDSDVAFQDLVLREQEDEAAGAVNSDPTRPRAKGGKLTEQNLKIWLSINPREPASRHQTLEMYLKSQRKLLEAEALAHTRAMQEARQLDNRMRDAYSQLRRSAYDMGSSAVPSDDTGGVRIKPPRSPTAVTAHGRSHSREVTLLENGMIVEHVDVRREEKEERERRRREERSRTRKSSRGSRVDITSVYSNAHTDSGVGLKPQPQARYSQASLQQRPLSGPAMDRPSFPRAYSQYSVSDVHSLGSASPTRPRFFGYKNLSTGWRSQESLAPSGMSGSVVDMHVALQREAQHQSSANRLSIARFRRSQMSESEPEREPDSGAHGMDSVKPKKKKSGFAKIWKKVTGSSKQDQMTGNIQSQAVVDDAPLAPPPSLSYLVNRTPGEVAAPGPRQTSTPSLGMSPGTTLSSPLPSPTPSADRENEGTILSGGSPDQERYYSPNEEGPKSPALRNVHPMTSEPDIRSRGSWSPSVMNNNFSIGSLQPVPKAGTIERDKSLPPLPGDGLRGRMDRPMTVYTFATSPGQNATDYSGLGMSPPNAPFCGASRDARRQSFGGMTTRPHFPPQTPHGGTLPTNQRKSLAPRYDEFAFSRRSLGRLVEDTPAFGTVTPSKRKSKFGLSSLFSKKSNERQVVMEPEDIDYRSLRRSGSGGEDYATVGGNATSTSRHSSSGGPPRMSVLYRKPIEELIDQDPEFVAYRYPSSDQRLDLLR